ncbi:MAG: PIN domain-containing protein [Sedimenticola sp.]
MLVVVIDTNVFVRETHLLRKKGGPTLVRLLRFTKGILQVSEILRREYVEQTIITADQQKKKIDTAYSNLETLLGTRINPIGASKEVAELRAEKRLGELEELTLGEPLTDELHVAAGNRTVDKKRPTSKTDHGYKDCLIWESVLRLPQGSDVRFVSNDGKAFFDGDKFHQDLISEALEVGITVKGYKDIERLIEDLIHENPEIDLVTLEAQELAEETPDLIEDAAPFLPVSQPDEAVGEDHSPPGDLNEVTQKLADAQGRFDGLDLKVLAYIAYLDSASKTDLFNALSDAGVAHDIAKNVAERLVMGGFVRDTGNHYLIADQTIVEIIVPTVETEIIAWLGTHRGLDGQ